MSGEEIDDPRLSRGPAPSTIRQYELRDAREVRREQDAVDMARLLPNDMSIDRLPSWLQIEIDRVQRESSRYLSRTEIWSIWRTGGKKAYHPLASEGEPDHSGLDPYPVHCEIPQLEESGLSGAVYLERHHWQGLSRGVLRHTDRWYTHDALSSHHFVGFDNRGRRPSKVLTT